ncbi:cytochrome P450 [Phlyctema vagabunda]|uniref:Cytochrome P450 n=1 Tax=Phlyctema vagabunda TaxID=108571 RepID=A0ABR4PBQ8_9HELO
MSYRRFLHPLARFPGPFFNSITNLQWHFKLFEGNVHLDNQHWHEVYGPVVRISPNHLSFSNLAAVKDIYGFGARESLRLEKDPQFFTPEIDGSLNIVNETNGNEHSRMRKMLSNAFSNSNLLSNDEIVIRRVNEFLDDLAALGENEGSSGVDIKKLFSYVTFNIMGEMALGNTFESLSSNQANRYTWADVIMKSSAMNDVMRGVALMPGLVALLSIYIPQHFRDTIYRHFEYSSQYAEIREHASIEQKDFMYHMLKSKMPNGQRVPKKEIASHSLVIMMAGTVTTATSLTAVTYYLLTNPSTVTKLRSELDAHFSSIDEMTSKALMNCQYLNAVIQEGLRINPPAGAAHLPRVVPKGGSNIAGIFVPEGTSVSVHPFSLSMNPQNFHEPRTFMPERWITSESEGQKGDRLEASVPFSFGPRGCIGKNLAYLELRMVLAKLFWKYDVEMTNTKEIKSWIDESVGYTLWKNPPLDVHVRERRDF